MSLAAGRTGLSGTAATGILAGTARPGFETVYSVHEDLQHLSNDQDLTTKIMRKRQEEMQRRTKLLDPRKRQYGADHQALDAQLAEKRKAQLADVEDEMRHAEAQLMQDQVLQHLEDVKQAAMRARHKAANEFSVEHLTKEKRREYYLSDPNMLKKDRPIDVDDPELGPSSFQKFEGQVALDPGAKKRLQQQEHRETLLKQMQDKAERAQAERDWEARFDREAMAAGQVRAYCEHVENEERRQDKLEEVAYNRELAKLHGDRRQARMQREADEKARHVEHVKKGFDQDQDWKLGSNGRLMKTEYKRMTLAEEQDVYDGLAQQVLDKQARREADIAEEAHHTRAIRTGVAVLGALEEERQRQQKEKIKKMMDHNKVLEAAKHRSDDDERRKYRSFEYEP